MGSSKKKKEKKKDFLKPKLKVGKTKAKAANFTDTSFKSKAIVMSKQSLLEHAPEPVQQFKHYLSLAATSRSDGQRRDALAYLTSQLTSKPPFNPVGTQTIMDKLLPLVSDSSGAVRGRLLRLFRSLPGTEVQHQAGKAIMYIRVGMTHLSKDVNNDSVAVLEWLIDVAGDATVSCPGGWIKPIKCFCAMLGWNPSGSSTWSSAPSAGLRTKDSQSHARQMTVLAKFLQVGLKPEGPAPRNPTAYWDQVARIPRTPHPFAYLNLFGTKRDEDSEMYSDCNSRQTVFQKRFFENVSARVDRLQKEGGVIGRAASAVDQAVKEGMREFEASGAVESQDLLELW